MLICLNLSFIVLPLLPTSEAQLTVTDSAVLCRAFFLVFGASVPLNALVELAPTMSPSILLQSLLFGSSVLKPDL